MPGPGRQRWDLMSAGRDETGSATGDTGPVAVTSGLQSRRRYVQSIAGLEFSMCREDGLSSQYYCHPLVQCQCSVSSQAPV